jgi:threonine aldolase
MKLMSRKTRKAIRKNVKKVIKRHGPEVAAGLAAGVASAVGALAMAKTSNNRAKREEGSPEADQSE